MFTASDSVVLGVVSGILTSAILWLAGRTFYKVVLPWYQGLVYQGLQISGSWIGFYSDVPKQSDDDDPDYSIVIRQKGHAINGIMTRLKTKTGARDVKELQFTGEFRDNNLVITYKPTDETRLGTGCHIMTLTDDGRILLGKCLFVVSNHKGKVSEFGMTWKRSSK